MSAAASRLARVLLSSPDLLLLDEPTNHLDAESVAWLERFLEQYKGTVVAVTHDRYFLDNVAGWILELDRGKGLPFQGNYSSWLEQKQVRLAIEEKTESARRRTLARELEWVRMSPKARHDKAKARVTSYEKLLADDQNVKLDKVEIHIPAGPRLGDIVVDADHVAKGFGDRLLVEDMTFSLPPGGIVGVIGPNGAGKTTLFRMIAGEEQPDSGALRIGETVELAYVDQARADLTPENTVWKEISGNHDIIELGKKEVNSRQYVSWFNFRGSDQQKRVSDLSGGERNRVHLAKLLRSGGNVLLLDEPTNDLDVDTLRALEDALLDFAGCAVVISHDRWFLDRIATHILAFEGDSQVTWYEGSYEEYAAWVKETRGAEALEPHRIKYKPLVPRVMQAPLAVSTSCSGSSPSSSAAVELERHCFREQQLVAGLLRQADLDVEGADRRDQLLLPVDLRIGVGRHASRQLALGDDGAAPVLDREGGAAVDRPERPGARALRALLADVVVRDDDRQPGLDVGVAAAAAGEGGEARRRAQRRARRGSRRDQVVERAPRAGPRSHPSASPGRPCRLSRRGRRAPARAPRS